MISVVATSSYVPRRTRSLDELTGRDCLQTSSEEWRESHAYFSEFIGSYGFDEHALVDAIARVDRREIRDSAGFDHVAVEDEMTLPEMCVEASKRILDPGSTPPLSAIVVCQTSADAQFRTNGSTALRLQCEYNLKELAFAVGDHDGVNFFVALSLLASLSEGEDGLSRILLCCGERWREPFPRVLGAYTVLGDAVGSMLLSNKPGEGFRLRGVHTESLHEAGHPWGLLLGSTPLPAADRVADAIGEFLRRHDRSVVDVTCVVPPHVNRRLVLQVHERLGITDTQDSRASFGRHGYLCAADPVVRLHEAFARLAAVHSPRGYILSWGIGLNGTVGCALFEADDNCRSESFT
jgi:3-oxoacyl-[acyl-carrier-protein] synthase III